jgi:excisionase family DNA binding protein
MQEAPELLTTVEVAERLRVSVSTVSRWAKAGELPVVRLGSLLRFRSDDVERILASTQYRADFGIDRDPKPSTAGAPDRWLR